MNLLAQAKQLGAVVYSGSLCLPAAALAKLLSIAKDDGRKIRYVECLYFYETIGAEPGGTEPSLELSRDFVRDQGAADFIAQAEQLAGLAMERAASRSIRPCFEVGLEPDLDPRGAGIQVRR